MGAANFIEHLIVPLGLLVLGVLLAVYVGIVAQKRGRRRWLWTLVALIANPIFTWIALALLPDESKRG